MVNVDEMSIFRDISSIKLNSGIVGRTPHTIRVQNSIGRVETVDNVQLMAELFK